jgi:hypothetical protein
MENNIQKEDLLALVKSKIYTIRGQKVMLDFDLAQMYNVETKRLNEAVRRNRKRFEGDDFMFRLTKDEIAQVALRSQNVTLNRGRGSNIKYLPYAFTELGVAMLSSVLKSEIAINVNREIMRAFVHFRLDINESTRHQLDAISTALAELQAEHRQKTKRKPIGFIQPKDDDNEGK